MRCLLATLYVCALIPPVAAENDSTEAALLEEVRVQPQSFRPNHLLGELYAHKGDLTAAVVYLRKAFEIDPANYDNGYDLALVYLETGATQSSRQTIQSLIQRQDKAELHNLLGDVEEKEGHIQQSAEQYDAAARMDPSEKNLFDLANELLLHRGFQPALKVLDFSTRKYPHSAKLRVALGVAHYSLGQYDHALEALCQAVDLDPKDTRALDFLGKMYDVAPEKADEVTRHLARFAREYPNSAAANYYYALSLRRRTTEGHSVSADREAERLLLRAVKLSPEWADAHYQLGLLYEDESLEDKAIREYQISVRLHAELAKAHYRLARLYEKKGQPQLAKAELHAFEAAKAR
ncbi:MAG: tetratricopeptide repeat protein [Bryobacteraceae bacterium]